LDNLTHSLLGWALARAGLGRRSRLATPALIIGANIPDIDAVATLSGGVEHLAIRRGITHGPLAMIVLPVVLTAALILWARWRGARPDALPLRPGWLFALALLATLTHPALDWMNSYGVRLLEPFSHRWFYGDTLFIIDVWVLAMLGLGIALSRRHERAGRADWPMPARIALLAVLAYIGANRLITVEAVEQAQTTLEAQRGLVAEQVVANPVPLLFWQRDMLWRTRNRVGWGVGQSPQDSPFLSPPHSLPTHMPAPAIAAARRQDADAAAFLFWARMPYAQIEQHGAGTRVTLRDARFANPLVADRFTVTVTVDLPPSPR